MTRRAFYLVCFSALWGCDSGGAGLADADVSNLSNDGGTVHGDGDSHGDGDGPWVPRPMVPGVDGGAPQSEPKWGHVETLDDFGTGKDHPQVAEDAEGNAWVLWSRSSTAGIGIQARRYNAKQDVWEEAVEISPPSESDVADVKVASFGTGEVIAAWLRSSTENNQGTGYRVVSHLALYAAAHRPGKGWSQPSKLFEGSYSRNVAVPFDVAAGPDGHGLVGWLETVVEADVSSTRLLARALDDEAWGAVEAVPMPPSDGAVQTGTFEASFKLGWPSRDHAWMVYRTSATVAAAVRTRGVWEPQPRILQDGIKVQGGLGAASQPNGGMAAAWQGNDQLFVSLQDGGTGAWSAPEALQNVSNATSITVVPAPAGAAVNAAVAWVKGDLQVARLKPDGTWADIVTPPWLASNYFHCAALTPDGELIAFFHHAGGLWRTQTVSLDRVVQGPFDPRLGSPQIVDWRIARSAFRIAPSGIGVLAWVERLESSSEMLTRAMVRR